MKLLYPVAMRYRRISADKLTMTMAVPELWEGSAYTHCIEGGSEESVDSDRRRELY